MPNVFLVMRVLLALSRWECPGIDRFVDIIDNNYRQYSRRPVSLVGPQLAVKLNLAPVFDAG